jgi:hypothetical protein
MTVRTFLLPVAGGLALLLSGCSEPPPTPVQKPAEEKIEPVTGQTALFKMFQVARTWDPHIQVLKLSSVHLNEVPEVRGKAGEWEGIFVSPTQERSRTYTFSVIELLPDLHKGVFSTADEAFSGQSGESKPFLIEAAKIDSDKAYQIALAKAGDYEKKNPGKPITLILELTPRHPGPAWRVIWGESASSSNYSVFVDANTGEYLEVMH